MLSYQEVETGRVVVSYTSTPEELKSKRKDALYTLKEQLKRKPLKGFRPGKAPDAVIAMKFKGELNDLVAKDLVVNAYESYVYESKAKVIGQPRLIEQNLTDNEYTCKFQCLCRPVFELKDYKSYSIPEPHQVQTSEEMVGMMMQELRNRNASFEQFKDEDVVQMGDKVNITYSVEIDGEKIEKLCKDKLDYRLGMNLFPDFDLNMIAMKVGDEKEFSLVLIGDNVPQSLKEQTANFKLTVHSALKRTLPPLDDILAIKAGLPSFEKLEETVNGIVINQQKNFRFNELSQQVTKRLLQDNEFTVPDWLSQMEAELLAYNAKVDLNTMSEQDRENFMMQGRENVRLAMIFDQIRDQEPEVVFSDQEMINAITHKVAEVGQDPNQYIKQAEQEGRLQQMIGQLKNQALMQWLIEKCKIIE